MQKGSKKYTEHLCAVLISELSTTLNVSPLEARKAFNEVLTKGRLWCVLYDSVQFVIEHREKAILRKPKKGELK